MNLLYLSLCYLRARALTNSLLVLLLVIGMATLSLALHVGTQIEDRLTRDARGIDLVVGAKGSPLQLVLSSVYHTDIPTGNILLQDAAKLMKHPQVKQAVPLALGDSYRGFRIVGTTADFVGFYGATLASGAMFDKPMQAVIGSEVARAHKLAVGHRFAGSHGLVESGDVHEGSPYDVVGVLAPTGSVVDRLILTPVESVWQVHSSHDHEEDHEEHKHDHDHGKKQTNESPREITALLVSYRNKMAAMTFPREVNRNTAMQAASPALEITRLLSLLGVGLETIRFFAFIFMASAFAGMAVAVYQSVQQRRYDLAVMRALGATKPTLLKQVLLEAAILLSIGVLCGLALGHGLMTGLPEMLGGGLETLSLRPFTLLREELWVVVGVFVVGLVAALLPALGVYRLDVSRLLSRR